MATRSDLINKLTHNNSEFSCDDMAYIVSTTFDYIASELASQKRLEIRGFGSFEVKEKRIVSLLAKNSGAMRKVVYYKQSSVLAK
jgi:integration host factor subunit beta